jgi:hypothetical protein
MFYLTRLLNWVSRWLNYTIRSQLFLAIVILISNCSLFVINFLKNKVLFADDNYSISIILYDIGILIYDYSNPIRNLGETITINNKRFYGSLETEANFIIFKNKMALISTQLIKYLNINLLFPLYKKKKEIEDLISGSQENDPILLQSLNEINNRINSQVNILMPAI